MLLPMDVAHGARLNRLYYGDNLDVLREHIADESVDLIYLDPPFNSDRIHNVLFRERSGMPIHQPRCKLLTIHGLGARKPKLSIGIFSMARPR